MKTRMRTLTLDEIWLEAGQHRRPEHAHIADGEVVCMSLLEAIGWVNGEPWSDRPRSVSPLLTGWGRMINDYMPPNPRQNLKEFIPMMIGTGTDPVRSARGDRARTWICARNIMRRWLPDYLERQGRVPLAIRVRDLPAVESVGAAAHARDVLRESRIEAWRAGHTVGAAVDKTWMFLTEAVMEGVNGDLGYRNIGTRVGEAYATTHTDTSWLESYELFEELLQVTPS